MEKILSRTIQICAALIMAGCGSKSSLPGFRPAASNLWTGVIVWNRDKTPAFGVLGGNDNHQFPTGPARGIKVKYLDGRTEWKNRDSIIKVEGYYFVRDDDSALSEKRWVVINE